MKKHIYTIMVFLVTVCSYEASSQNKSYLKHPLSKEDTLYLKAKIREYYPLSCDVNFAFRGYDIYPPKDIKPEKPFDIKQIEDLRKKLKGNYDDADIYYKMGYLYKYNYDKILFIKYLDRAIELYKQRVEAKPDSASSYDKLGNAYFYYENYKEAIKQYETAIKLNPHDTLARLAKVVNALSLYDTTILIKFIKENITEIPENINTYVALPTYYLLGWFQKFKSLAGVLNLDSVARELKNKTIDELQDLSLIKTAFKAHKNDVRYEMLYNISRQSVLFVKTAIVTVIHQKSDTTTTNTVIKFALDKQDSIELDRLEKFYLMCEKRKDVPSKYGTYKWLASVYYMKADYKQASLYLRKAIQQMPISKSTFEYNSQGDYLNLAGIYLLHYDTANYEKTITEKFKLKPGINEVPDDYVLMGKIAFYNKNYEQAKQYGIGAMNKQEYLEDSYLLIAATEIESNNIASALSYLDRAYKLKNDDETIFIFAAIGNLLNKDAANAYMFFNKAIELGADKETIDKDFINKFYIVK